MPARLVLLICIAAALLCGDSWDGVERVVAIGDVHGDFNQFVQVLRYADLIDVKNKWSGGKTHVVQLGDIPDRGPDTRKIMDFLMDLEKQAKKKGGMVHVLIGNHEAMNIYGDLRYTIPEEFTAFKTIESEQVRSQFWDLHLNELRQKGEGGKATAEYRKQWDKEHPAGWFEHRIEFGPQGRYYKWILSRNAVVRINDTLFLHGGLSPKYAAKTREDINRTVVEELKDLTKLVGGMVPDEEGPLWYRGLAHEEEAKLAEHVDGLLKLHGVKRIVVGHSPTAGAILPRFGGKVLLADVGLSAAHGGRSACVVIQGDQVSALHRGKRLALPAGSGAADLVTYLKEAAALDPAPSPLLGAISALEQATVAQAAQQ